MAWIKVGNTNDQQTKVRYGKTYKKVGNVRDVQPTQGQAPSMGGWKKVGNVKGTNVPSVAKVPAQRPLGVNNPNYKNALVVADNAKQAAIKANSITGLAKETAKGVTKSLAEFIPKTAVSLAETPGTLIRGTATQKTYNLPVIGKFQSYQSEAENTAKDIIEGKKPLYSALKPFAELPLNFLPLGNKLAPSSLTGKLLSKEAIRVRIGESLAPLSTSSVPQGLKKIGNIYTGPGVQTAMNPRLGLGAKTQQAALELPVSRIQSAVKSESGLVPESLSYTPIQSQLADGVNDPIQKITEALKAAKPLEKEQSAIYSAERAKRVARMVAAGKTPGEQGYFRQLGALKGELPKVQFESLRGQVTQGDIDHLFNSVEGSRILTPFEKITAKSGLSKLLGKEGGQVPTRGELELLGEVFPPEFMKQVLEKRPLMQKVVEKAGDVLNIPRSLMSSFDLSAPLRQGVFLIGRPKQWGPAFKDMFKYALSEKSYQGLTESIQARPTYQLMRENRLALTDMSKFASKREEVFMSNLAEKIPGIGKMIRASDRAYTGFLNKLRADTFDDLVTKLGKDQAPDIARFVNSATGRGELPEILRNSQALLNGAFFSPRLIASRVNLMNPQYYMSLSAPVRKEALKSLLSFGSTVATVLGLANLAGAEVGADPRSADFAKIKVGDTRYDVLGGFQQYAVLAYRLATNEAVSSTTGREFRLDEGYNAPGRLGIMMRFLQSKESPVAGFVAGLLSGKDNGGSEFKLGPEIVNRFIPMLTNDLLATISEEGPVKGSLMQAPAVFGVGTNTYTDQIPTLEKTPTGRPTIKWEGYPTVGDKVSNFLSGKEVSNIPKEQWAPLYQERLKEQKRKVELDKAKETVLISGQPQYVGDTFIYLDNGIVKTKKITPTDRTPLQKKVLNPFYTK